MSFSFLDLIVCSVALQIALFIYHYRRLGGPRYSIPFVNSMFLGLGTGYAFYARRTPFLDECGNRYGRAYKFACGFRNMHIISTPSDLRTFFLHPQLDHKEAHFKALIALGSSGDSELLSVPVHEHFLPSFGRALSRRIIAEEITTSLYTELRHNFQKIQLRSRHRLSEVIGRTLYDTLSRITFGPSFPPDTFNDFMTLDLGMNALMGPLAFMSFSATRARNRLIKVMETYIQENGDFAGENVSIVSSALRSVRSLPLREKSACLLSLHWSINSNLLKSIWWMTAYLALDADARNRLVEDMTIATSPEKFDADLRPRLAVNPYFLFDQFLLVDASVTETLRLHSLPGSVRTAVADTEFPLDDGGKFCARPGDMIMADIRQQHMSDAVYSDATTFKVDRFYRASDVPKILAWGGGPHMCKGRIFAHHVMKVWAVAFLQIYDFTTEDLLPGMAPQSANVMADPSADITIKLHRRSHVSESEETDI